MVKFNTRFEIMPSQYYSEAIYLELFFMVPNRLVASVAPNE